MSPLPPLSELYQKHHRRAVALARRILRDSDEAEDVVQDVFVRIWALGAPFKGTAAYTTWLHRVLVNSSINSLRSRRRRGRLTSSIASSVGPEEAVVNHQEHALLVQAMSRLSEQHRQVVTLRDLWGYSYPEIAHTLGLPEGTVKSALNRARRALGDHMRALVLSHSPDLSPTN